MRWKVNSQRTLYQDQWVHLLSLMWSFPTGGTSTTA